MSNRRFIILFLLGIGCLSAALVFLSFRAQSVATEATRTTLCMCAPGEVRALEVRRYGTNLVTLVRGEKDAWNITRPYRAMADAPAVARLVDAVTVTPLGDLRTESELAELGEKFTDFGLVEQAPVGLTVRTARGEMRIFFGALTATGQDVYARVEGLQNVFTLPARVLAAVPADADGFRRRALVTVPREDITGLDLRASGKPFVKLVQKAGGWNLAAPIEAPADATAVAKLADGLAQAKIVGFVLPSAANHAGAMGTDPSDALGTGPSDALAVAIKTDALVPYGLASGEGHAVVMRTANGATEQIVFGKGEGTNLVYALVRNGTAVVTLEAQVADLCRASGESFRDLRVFPLAEKERVESISFSVGASVYVLAQDTNKVWRLETPVAAPADAKVAAAFAEVVFKLRHSDVPDIAPPEQDSVGVSITTSCGARAGKVVPRKLFAACGAFADLRSKTLLTLDPASVRRITVTTAEGRATAVSRADPRAIWCLDRSAGAKPANVKSEVVKSLLTALTQVEAESVETVVATPVDRRRCGLEPTTLTVAIDFFGADLARCNLLIGGAAANGARFATVGGADAIFILPRATIQLLETPLTDEDLPGTVPTAPVPPRGWGADFMHGH